MRRARGLLLAVVAITIAACSGSADDPTGRTWQLTELEGSAPVEASVVDMTIEEGQVSGSGGCNQYTGPATVDTDGNAMTLGPEIVSTQMACEDAVTTQEQRYFDALTRVTSYEMANDTLTLLDADGIALATFE